MTWGRLGTTGDGNYPTARGSRAAVLRARLGLWNERQLQRRPEAKADAAARDGELRSQRHVDAEPVPRGRRGREADREGNCTPVGGSVAAYRDRAPARRRRGVAHTFHLVDDTFRSGSWSRDRRLRDAEGARRRRNPRAP